MEPAEAACEELLTSCREGDRVAAKAALEKLRQTVLLFGLAAPREPRIVSSLTLRGKVWKALLGLDRVDAEEYAALVRRGPAPRYHIVRDDSFRTFPEAGMFRERHEEARLVRILNSFDHRRPNGLNYLQGMNAVAAAFLACMPEADAYFACSRFIGQWMPLYWTENYCGATAACKLLDQVLGFVDPELSNYLRTKGLSAKMYAFPCLSSLSAIAPPFSELLRLWDFLLAFGVHLNVLCVAAQILLIRSQLLSHPNPKAVLDYRKWPHLRACAIISVTMDLVPQLHPQLYQQIRLHTTDPHVVSRLIGRDINFTPERTTVPLPALPRSTSA